MDNRQLLDIILDIEEKLNRIKQELKSREEPENPFMNMGISEFVAMSGPGYYTTKILNVIYCLVQFKEELIHMPVKDFIVQYSPKDYLAIKQAGRKSINELINRFNSAGIRWV